MQTVLLVPILLHCLSDKAKQEDMSCMHKQEKHMEHMEGRCLTIPFSSTAFLPLVFVSFPLFEASPPALWQKSASPSKGQGEGCLRQPRSLQWTRRDALKQHQKAAGCVGTAWGDRFHRRTHVQNMLPSESHHTHFPRFLRLRPRSRRELKARCWIIVSKDRYSFTATAWVDRRWIKVNLKSQGGVKSSPDIFAKQKRQAYGCLVLPRQLSWEMVFLAVIKLSHNPITSVIFMILPLAWAQSLCLTRQLDKC